MVAVAVGPWTLPFAPWTAFGLFIAVSLVLLAVSAGIVAYQLEGGSCEPSRCLPYFARR